MGTDNRSLRRTSYTNYNYRTIADMAKMNIVLTCMGLMIMLTSAASIPLDAGEFDRASRKAECAALADQYLAKKNMDAKATANLNACCYEVSTSGTPEEKAGAAAVCVPIRKAECAAVADQYVAKNPMDAKATATLNACCYEVSSGGTAEDKASAAPVCVPVRKAECAAVANLFVAKKTHGCQSQSDS